MSWTVSHEVWGSAVICSRRFSVYSASGICSVNLTVNSAAANKYILCLFGSRRGMVKAGNHHQFFTSPVLLNSCIWCSAVLFCLQPTVNVDAVVSNPGKYVLVGHYYQPYITGFDVDVYVNVHGQTYKGQWYTSASYTCYRTKMNRP